MFHNVGSMILSSDQWATLLDAMRAGSVQSLHCRRVDFGALDDDAFLLAVRCRGLQSIRVRDCVVPSGLVTDDLIRSSIANGLRQLRFSGIKTDAPHAFSEDALLDFFFETGATPKGRKRNLELQGYGITDTFVRKFFE
ncbi:hypothetical protein AAVH_35114, partial [Aphelenchoides avenae]